MASHFSSFAIFIILFPLVSSELVLEEGYTVTTVIDGHKLKINPYSVIPRPGSSELLLLDSSNSLFYTILFPLSQGSVVKRLSGDGSVGHNDGELASAKFRRPRSFAVDLKGNVYVADGSNNAIRKITNSGVTTIAGGYSKKAGNEDGPAQNATFSADFELTFVPGICALLMSDRGNQLVRQINLKPEDCSRTSESALGAVSLWVLGLVLSCFLGLVTGIVVRPYIIRHECPNLLRLNVTWMHYLIDLVKQVQMLCFGMRSVVASSALCALLRRLFWLCTSYVWLMFRINSLESKTLDKDASLLDCNDLRSCEIKKSPISAHQLEELMSSDGNLDLLTGDIVNQGNENQGTTDVLSDPHGKLDNMIKANIAGFAGEVKDTTSVVGSSGLVRRHKQ